jgi:hypothetical protein
LFFTTDRAVQEEFRGGDRSGSRVAAGRIYKIFLEGTWSRISDILAILWAYDLYGPVRNAFDAGRTITRASGRGFVPWKLRH